MARSRASSRWRCWTDRAKVPTTTRTATSRAVPPMAPPMETSLIRAAAASRNSTGPRSSPTLTWAPAPPMPVPVSASARRIRWASSPGWTPGAGRTPIAVTCPSRAASRWASASEKNRALCRVSRLWSGRAMPLTVYSSGTPVAWTVSRLPGRSPARAASSRSTTTSPRPCGARPSASVKGVSAAELQACPYGAGGRAASPPPWEAGCPTRGTAWKVSSGTARSTPGTERTAPSVAAGSQARSVTGLALCLALVLPFFSLTVVRCTFWSAETRTGVAA